MGTRGQRFLMGGSTSNHQICDPETSRSTLRLNIASIAVIGPLRWFASSLSSGSGFSTLSSSLDSHNEYPLESTTQDTTLSETNGIVLLEYQQLERLS